MGVSTTHYVVIGVSLTDEKLIKEFSKINEDHYDELNDHYYDNPYKREITPTESGIHIIADGMCGKYVVVGKIITKGLEENGLKFTELGFVRLKYYSEIYPEVLKLDKMLGTEFGMLEAKILVFSHYH